MELSDSTPSDVEIYLNVRCTSKHLSISPSKMGFIYGFGLLCVVSVVVLAKRPISVTSSGYKAAVLEHQFLVSDRCMSIADYKEQATCIKRENLEVFEQHIADAARQGAEIIVFPENALHGRLNRQMAANYAETIPEPNTGWTPCDDEVTYRTHTAQYYYSCMALRYNMYVVGNCVDHQTKADGLAGTYLYNTAVAYDRTGALVAKYHKYNLFSFEALTFDRPSTAGISYFDTHFGRVGVFICFDVLFREPAYELVKRYGIKQIAFPTGWIDELPMWSAVGVHSAWAMTMGVNFLSANFRLPETTLVGSGVFSPDGPLIFTRNTTIEGSILLVTFVPTADRTISHTHHLPFQDVRTSDEPFESRVFHDLHKFKSLPSGSHMKKVCMNNFCCRLKYSARIPDHEKYALGVFSGLHTAAQQYLNFQNCIVTKCASLNSSSCGQSVSNTEAKFNSLHLEGNFAAKYIFPTVLLDDVQLPEIGSYNFSLVQNAYISSARGFEEPMLMAALHGRIYLDNE